MYTYYVLVQVILFVYVTVSLMQKQGTWAQTTHHHTTGHILLLE